MIFCKQCGHWHGNSKRACAANDELATMRARSFVAVMATYSTTMKHKHIRIALRAYCEVHKLNLNEVIDATRDIVAAHREAPETICPGCDGHGSYYSRDVLTPCARCDSTGTIGVDDFTAGRATETERAQFEPQDLNE